MDIIPIPYIFMTMKENKKAGVIGIEPISTESKSVVLTIIHIPLYIINILYRIV